MVRGLVLVRGGKRGKGKGRGRGCTRTRRVSGKLRPRMKTWVVSIEFLRESRWSGHTMIVYNRSIRFAGCNTSDPVIERFGSRLRYMRQIFGV